jgi:Patatin-like phospholipase
MRFALVSLLLAVSAFCLGACASQPRTAFTEPEQMAALPIGKPSIRYWADVTANGLKQTARSAVVQKGRPFVYLALSGGGGSGAYGAGLLKGWTESGARPEFTIVSGVSTGALIAPFAFLGPDYDDKLKQMYTDGDAQELVERPNPLNIVFNAGLFQRDRLRRLVARYLDDEMLAAIAKEDAKGRRLLVVTTDLDAQRAVVWDMGAIASSGGAKAFNLFRDVLAASASVPVLFAPQLIDVEADGRVFQEMHTDGTVTAPIYTLPDAILFGGKPIAQNAKPALYIIVNARIDPGFAVVPDQVEAIAVQSFSTMNRVAVKAVLAASYSVAKREGFSFHLSYIDRDHPESGGTGFESQAMRQLYDYGYEKARSGSFWVTRLSDIEAAKEAATKATRPATAAGGN